MRPTTLFPTFVRARRALARGGFARLVIGVWLAVHGFVVAAAPAADAAAGHVESVVAHWEDAQDSSCPPLHDPATCQLCQQVTTEITSDGTDRLVSTRVDLAAGSRPTGRGVGAHDTALRGASDPRGPPAV